METGRSTNPPWLSSAEACALLGVKPKTLYSYVSRGLLRSIPGPGRTRRYLAHEVQRLRARKEDHGGHQTRARSALSFGGAVLETQVGGIDEEGPWLRGERAVDLVHTPFEQVVGRLWEEELAGPLDAHPTPGVRTLAQLQARVATSEETRPQTGWELLGRLAGPLVERPAPTLAEALAPRSPALVNGALVLLIDHGLNASTFAARVVASTGAPLGACVLAGLSALSGPRHGNASLALERSLEHPPTPAGPGFDHPLYPHGDPRALWLLEQAPPPPRLAERIDWQAQRGLHPNVDAGLLSLCAALGWPSWKAPLLFALGRCAGWIAHAREQRERPEILRPRAAYGPWVRGT